MATTELFACDDCIDNIAGAGWYIFKSKWAYAGVALFMSNGCGLCDDPLSGVNHYVKKINTTLHTPLGS